VFGLAKVDQWDPIRISTIKFRSHPMQFLGFSNHEKGSPRQEIFSNHEKEDPRQEISK
jgi:hypothetical protein